MCNYDLKDTVYIEVDWNSEMSIKLAEKVKAKLENDGWHLVNSFGGVRISKLCYAKEVL